MKSMLMILALLALASVAGAEKPILPDVDYSSRAACVLAEVVHDWDFALGDMGFTRDFCEDDPLIAPAWEYGDAAGFVPDPPGGAQNLWGTVLTANYMSQTGDALRSPQFEVTVSAYKVEVLHWFNMENNFDGMNVTVNGQIVEPIEGYPAIISTSTSYYAWCVNDEPGLTGDAPGWLLSCFDLSAFMGQTVQICFDFGTDSSVTDKGWYLASVKVGMPEGVATGEATWGRIKDLYK